MFDLDPTIDFLNHGSFGAVPRVVTTAVAELRAEMERNPVAFVEDVVRPGRRRAAAELAARLGTDGDHLALIENASTGTATVLASLAFKAGDRVVVTDHGYNAVRLQLEALARRAGIHVAVVHLPTPIEDPTAVVAAISQALPGARLLVVDWITSPTGLVMPIEAIVAAAKAEGVPVLVDAAHAPGHVPMELDRLGADWVTGNAHKWLFAARGTAFLYARTDPNLAPQTISHYNDEGFPRAFDWTGTGDPCAHLALPTALAFHRDQPDVMARNRDLAMRAGALIANTLGSVCSGPPSMQGAMAAVRLPLRGDRGDGASLHRTLRDTHRIEVPIMAQDGWLWVRVSAQIYNRMEQYERLAAVLYRALH